MLALEENHKDHLTFLTVGLTYNFSKCLSCKYSGIEMIIIYLYLKGLWSQLKSLILGCIRKSMAGSWREGILPLC